MAPSRGTRAARLQHGSENQVTSGAIKVRSGVIIVTSGEFKITCSGIIITSGVVTQLPVRDAHFLPTFAAVSPRTQLVGHVTHL